MRPLLIHARLRYQVTALGCEQGRVEESPSGQHGLGSNDTLRGRD
jgi:hypothetical protein